VTVAQFKPLTVAEANTLTRGQLLDRIEVEQEYWHRKAWHRMSEADQAAEQEFGRIMHAALDPGAGLSDLLDYLNGKPGAGRYFDERPNIPAATSPGATTAPVSKQTSIANTGAPQHRSKGARQ
jgi:hypothetical protein